MRAELVTTPSARLRGYQHDALKIKCSAKELPVLTTEDTAFEIGGKRYYFTNNQSFANKENGRCTVWLYAD